MLRRANFIIIFFVLLVLSAGCANLTQFSPVRSPELTASEVSKIGAVAEDRLLQLLGGRYYHKRLSRELTKRADDVGFRVVIADRSSASAYPLPGNRAVITRGLLMQVESVSQLDSVLQKVAALSRGSITDNSSRSLVKAIQEFSTAKPSIYDPDAADIRIASVFADNPCEDSCLYSTGLANFPKGELPEVFKELKDLHSGYQVLVEARKTEKAGDVGRAIATYLQAATVTPDQAQILGALGMAYLRAGDLQAARLHLEKADKLQSDYYKTKMGLGYLSLKSEKMSQAKKYLAESVELLPVSENIFLLAEAMEKSGDAPGALRLYEIVAKHDRRSKLGRIAVSRIGMLKVKR